MNYHSQKQFYPQNNYLNKGKAKRFNIGTCPQNIEQHEEEIVLSKTQRYKMNHLYSKVAENDTLTVRKD